MPRLPFSAASARGGDEPPRRGRSSDGRPDAIAVGEVCRMIGRALEDGLPPTLRVQGELSGLSNRNHWYFTLKDEAGVLSCVAWASAAARFSFVPQEGELVVATGSVNHYAPQGRTQLYVTKLEPLGTGALALRFRALCDELRRLGYFDDAHKVPLPAMPRRIAVITSATGAALRDVIDTAQRRWPGVGLLVVDVRVQGDGAAEQVAEAIGLVDRHAARLGVDAILVTRGGGSIEDLWAFNERVVADATFRCRLPLVAAIGHESDTTVIELVADLRAATPTQAIMRLVPDRVELARQVAQLNARLALLLRRRVEIERRRLDGLRRNELLRRPQAILVRHREALGRWRRDLVRGVDATLAQERRRLDSIAARLRLRDPRSTLAQARRRCALATDRLSRTLRSRLALVRQRLDGAAQALRVVDPESIVRRGYSITTLEDGTVVRSVAAAPSGTSLVTRLADGRIRSVVADGAAPHGGAGLGGKAVDDPTARRAGGVSASSGGGSGGGAGGRAGGRKSTRRASTPDDGAMDLFADAE